MLAKSTKTTPANPSELGWTASEILKHQYQPSEILFDYMDNLEDYYKDYSDTIVDEVNSFSESIDNATTIVNALDSRVSTNEKNIATNTSNIETNKTNIATNEKNINTNASDIDTLEIANEVNKANIASNTSRIAKQEAKTISDYLTSEQLLAVNSGITATKTKTYDNMAESITTHETRLTQVEKDIASNTSNISANKTDIATNKANIATNKANIATNTKNIETLNANSSVNGSIDYKIKVAIDNLVNGAPEAYDTLKEIAEYIASDETNTASMLASIQKNTANIATNKSNIATNANNIATLDEEVVKSDLTNLNTDRIILSDEVGTKKIKSSTYKIATTFTASSNTELSTSKAINDYISANYETIENHTNDKNTIESNIATNEANITKNAANIATNTSDIETLKTSKQDTLIEGFGVAISEDNVISLDNVLVDGDTYKFGTLESNDGDTATYGSGV